ncbi:MAG: hypothetical protein J0I66_09335, partial [Microbacterium sp.]|nr:hypothetical protein [Microbacterium sp.]
MHVIAAAEPAATQANVNALWLLVAAALVLLMTPGVAFFYGGMVKAKSVVSMMMMSFGAIALVAVLWVLYGYGMSFGTPLIQNWLGNPFDGLIGLGKAGDLKELDWSRLGGTIMGALRKGEAATLLAERPDGVDVSPAEFTEIGLGASLRAYAFDRYRSRPKDDDSATKAAPSLAIVGPGAGKAKKLWPARAAVAGGVVLARDLVNEPANVLGTLEFAAKAEALADLGV